MEKEADSPYLQLKGNGKRAANFACTDLDLMIGGKEYYPTAPQLAEARSQSRLLCRKYNKLCGKEQYEAGTDVLERLLGSIGKDVRIEPTFRCDYGFNIYLEKGVYFNYDCVILDCAEVRIGSETKFGPGVHLYTASHPSDPLSRESKAETAHPIVIGRNVWIGGRSVVLPGVSIGDNSVIGAGSVVSRDIPASSLALGLPARVIRKL